MQNFILNSFAKRKSKQHIFLQTKKGAKFQEIQSRRSWISKFHESFGCTVSWISKIFIHEYSRNICSPMYALVHNYIHVYVFRGFNGCDVHGGCGVNDGRVDWDVHDVHDGLNDCGICDFYDFLDDFNIQYSVFLVVLIITIYMITLMIEVSVVSMMAAGYGSTDLRLDTSTKLKMVNYWWYWPHHKKKNLYLNYIYKLYLTKILLKPSYTDILKILEK